MRKKTFKKFLTILTILIIGLNSVLPYTISWTYAEDSPEEIARQEEEARREAERRAQREAEEAAQQAAEDAREAVEDLPPTPTSIPQTSPTTDPLNSVAQDNTSVSNDTTSSTNSDVSVDNSNTGELNNNVNSEANTGNNVISGDNPPTPTPTIYDNQSQDPLGQCEDNLQNAADIGGEEDTFLHEGGEISQTESETVVSDSSTSQSSTEDNDTVTVSNSNCASLENDQQVSSTTGGNDASGNEGSEMQTGTASSDSSLINEGNNNTVSGTTQGDPEISTTDNDQVAVDNNNQIYVENEVKAESSSGGNTINDNDGNAEVSTGDIDMMVTLLNILNLNLTGEDFTHLIVNIFGDLTGDIDLDKIAKSLGMNEEELIAIARNEETEAQKNLEMSVNNTNEAVVKNNVDVNGVSGNNTLSGNEDRTRVLTGRIKILVALINFINTNYSGTQWYFAMVNIFGSLEGDLILPDPNSFLVDESTSTSQETGGQDITNTTQDTMNVSSENQATVTNNVNVTGDSGSNSAYNNEDRVSQDTGEVNVVTQLTNWLNVNIFGNNWVLLVINVFGKWYGKIVGFPGQGTIEAPDSGMLMVAAGGEGGSGPTVSNSTGDTTNSETNNWDVNNQNTATLENNVNVSGVSGGNTTNSNEDPVAVSTGWIDISTNLLNIVNMNITGKKWMLVLVNIFGDFFGDITFPGVKKPEVVEFRNEGEVSQTADNTVSQVGGISESNDDSTANTVVTITPTPTTKIILLASAETLSSGEENKIEVYKADSPTMQTVDSINSREDEMEILGVSIKASRDIQQILFLIALITYLIALRFWAFKKIS